MGRARYTEIRTKSALNRVPGMPFKWSLNPYRGCRHSCTYCYARTTHTFLDLDAGHDFDELIFVKVNLPEALRRELVRPGWQRRRETVAIGTASDPYQGIEGRYRLTRACLEVFADCATPANVTTKGTLVVRDVDVLQHLAARAGSGVSFSLITLDERIWRAVEPGTPPPRQRLAALERLAAAGVPCGLALAPVLPGLTDSPAALEAVVRAAAEHGAQWLWSGTLHLEPAVRDWFLQSLERYFPRSVAAYARVFGGVGAPSRIRYAPKAYAERVQRQVGELKERYGLAERRRPAPVLESTLPGGDPAPARTRALPPQTHQLTLPL
ncbi:MAG: radical SAM protein [Chloroflexi bacterium]|nr:radical SAM protein [Chloroflexota bacterium]